MKIEVGNRYLTDDDRIAFCFDEYVNGEFVIVIERSPFGFVTDESGVVSKVRGKEGGEGNILFKLIKCLDDEIRITAAEVGKRCRFRNSEEGIILDFEEGESYPVLVKSEKIYSGQYSTDGRYIKDYDIVEILEDETEESDEPREFTIRLEKSELGKIIGFMRDSKFIGWTGRLAGKEQSETFEAADQSRKCPCVICRPWM